MILPLALVLVAVVIAKIWARFKASSVSTPRSNIVAAVNGLIGYSRLAANVADHKRTRFFTLDKSHQQVALSTLQRYRQARTCAQANSLVLNEIVHAAINRYNISSWELATTPGVGAYKVFETLNHLVRDFCDLTAEQRSSLFQPILDEARGRCLVPGSGVGGLALELAQLKGTSEVVALELDPALHIAAEFAQESIKTFTVYPWASEYSHLRRGDDQLESGVLSFTGGSVAFLYEDFLSHKGQYDTICTLFFIDTAENALAYFDKIKDLLAPEGRWINYGPLKWGTAPKVEFSLDEIISYLETQGWEFDSSWEGKNRYSGSPKSMWSANYELQGWTASRPSLTPTK